MCDIVRPIMMRLLRLSPKYIQEFGVEMGRIEGMCLSNIEQDPVYKYYTHTNVKGEKNS